MKLLYIIIALEEDEINNVNLEPVSGNFYFRRLVGERRLPDC